MSLFAIASNEKINTSLQDDFSFEHPVKKPIFIDEPFHWALTMLNRHPFHLMSVEKTFKPHPSRLNKG